MTIAWILLGLGLIAWTARVALAVLGLLAERHRYLEEESCR